MSGHRVSNFIKDADDIYVLGGKLKKFGKDEEQQEQAATAGAKKGSKKPLDATSNAITAAVASAHSEYSLGAAYFFKFHQPPATAEAARASVSRKRSESVMQRQPTGADYADLSKTSENLPPLPPPLPPLKLVWRMPLCYVKGVAHVPNAPGNFCVSFFSFKPQRKDPNTAKSPMVRKLHEGAPRLVACVNPELRVRHYVAFSDFERDEWTQAWQAVLVNYWHQRLEQTHIRAPQIYQYHTWCVEGGRQLRQLVLSNSYVYLIDRSSEGSFKSGALDKGCVAFPIVRLQECKAVKNSATMVVSGKDLVPAAASAFGDGSGGVISLSFFTLNDLILACVELKRIWGMNARDVPFPHTTVVE